MIHIIFSLILLSMVSNGLYSAMNRVNNPLYHWFEIIMLSAIFALGYFICKYDSDYVTWAIIYVTLRFGLYNILFNAIIKQRIDYLGDWGIDRFWKWLLYQELNQPNDLILYVYFMSTFIGVGLYLGLIFN